MMVPRSFTYSSQRQSSPSPSRSPRRSSPGKSSNQRNSSRRTSPVHSISRPQHAAPSRLASDPVATLSKSPTGQEHCSRVTDSSQTTRPSPALPKTASAPQQIPQTEGSRGQDGRGGPVRRTQQRTNSRIQNPHQPNAVPSAIAALLAITAIPPPRPVVRRRRSAQALPRRISIDELVEEWRREEAETARGACGDKEGGDGGTSYGSPIMDILLERPGEDEMEDEQGIETVSSGDSSMRSMDKNEGDVTDRQALSSRSLSTESMPSLDSEERSLSSWEPLTPSSGRRVRSDRKEKKPMPSPSERCVLDHPLQPHRSTQEGLSIPKEPLSSVSRSRRPQPTPLRSFKSNLTASLSALANAAKSFSNFAAPSIPPDDLLSRGLLSSQYPSEMRPKPLEGPPTPALRRYLNPATLPSTAISSEELPAQLHQAMLFRPCSPSLAREDPDADPDVDAPMIKMHTYGGRHSGQSSRSQNRRRSVPASSQQPQASGMEGALFGASGSVRQREPRENANFLRVIVLEMNMRRGGKLDSKAAGRARIWLPPRTTAAIVEAESCGQRGDESENGTARTSTGGDEGGEPGGGEAPSPSTVPRRWVGISVDD